MPRRALPPEPTDARPAGRVWAGVYQPKGLGPAGEQARNRGESPIAFRRSSMKRILSLLLCAVLALTWTASLLAAEGGSSGKPRIAVLEFSNKANNQWWFQ